MFDERASSCMQIPEPEFDGNECDIATRNPDVSVGGNVADACPCPGERASSFALITNSAAGVDKCDIVTPKPDVSVGSNAAIWFPALSDAAIGCGGTHLVTLNPNLSDIGRIPSVGAVDPDTATDIYLTKRPLHGRNAGLLQQHAA